MGRFETGVPKRIGAGMSVVVGTICLNEMEWLPRLYEQHKDWPGLRRWVFIESADRMYAQANPELVTDKGLSVDGTTEFLEELAKQDDRIEYIRFGFGDHDDVEQGKCPARQKHLDRSQLVKPKYVLTLDADEFYTYEHQRQLDDKMLYRNVADGLPTRYRNIWRPPSIRDQPLFQYEMTGKFWAIVVCKLWKWFPGLRYRGNHNAPFHHNRCSNKNLDFKYHRWDKAPEFIHMGFACERKYRVAKNRYYVERGEKDIKSRRLPKKIESRSIFETWKPGDVLPPANKIVKYTGPIPECFDEV